MDFWKDLFSIAQSVITGAGIIMAGIWTYLVFVRQRLGLPKVDIDLSIDDIILPEGGRLIHAEIKLKNTGSVVVKSDYGELRLRQVVPIPDEFKGDIEGGYDPVGEGNTEVEWPMIAGREWKWSKNDLEIEPGECDSLHADYIIPVTTKTVQLYCYISNAKKKRRGLGWTCTKLYTFNSNMEVSRMADRERNHKSPLTKQQRQQKQQPTQQKRQPMKNNKPKKEE